MKKFIVDTNFFLRFILKDNLSQWQIADNYFLKARNEKITLIFLTEIILEIEYVMRKVYNLNRTIIFKYISTLLAINNFEIADRDVLRNALLLYLQKNIDLIDCVLCQKAKSQKAEILAFDRDFKKCEK
jgi:predicted nucleic-acid-binding protein